MTLPIVHSETYQRHHPAFEIGRAVASCLTIESPQRAEIMLEALRATSWAKIVTPEEGRH